MNLNTSVVVRLPRYTFTSSSPCREPRSEDGHYRLPCGQDSWAFGSPHHGGTAPYGIFVTQISQCHSENAVILAVAITSDRPHLLPPPAILATVSGLPYSSRVQPACKFQGLVLASVIFSQIAQDLYLPITLTIRPPANGHLIYFNRIRFLNQSSP